MTKTNILFPPGRLVMGDLYNPQDKNMDGKPLTTADGKPRVNYFFAVAIPKTPGHTHWAQTEWGAQIYAAGQQAFPTLYQLPKFSWKVIDGDSREPNEKGRKPCDQEGFPGCWVVRFGSGYAPKVYNATGTEMLPAGAVKPGYFVQVFGNVEGNGSTSKPGVYVNHGMVAMSGYGPEIVVGPDPTAVGFGQAPLPAGASATPVGGLAVPPVTPPPVPAMPAAPVLVQPNPAFAAVAPPPLPAPPMPPMPAAAPVRQMTPKAAGATYEQFIASGWTDATLIQNGYMLP